MMTAPPTPREVDRALADAIHALNAVETPAAFDPGDIAQLRRRLPAARATLRRVLDDLHDRDLGRGSTPLSPTRLYADAREVVCGRRQCAGVVPALTGRSANGDALVPLPAGTAQHSPTVTCRCGCLTSATTGPLAGIALTSA